MICTPTKLYYHRFSFSRLEVCVSWNGRVMSPSTRCGLFPVRQFLCTYTHNLKTKRSYKVVLPTERLLCMKHEANIIASNVCEKEQCMVFLWYTRITEAFLPWNNQFLRRPFSLETTSFWGNTQKVVLCLLLQLYQSSSTGKWQRFTDINFMLRNSMYQTSLFMYAH